MRAAAANLGSMSGHPKGSYPAKEDVRQLAFLLHGSMVCGMRGEDLIMRVAAEEPMRPWVSRAPGQLT